MVRTRFEDSLIASLSLYALCSMVSAVILRIVSRSVIIAKVLFTSNGRIEEEKN